MTRQIDYAVRANAGCVEICQVTRGEDPNEGDVDYMTPEVAKAFAYQIRVAAIAAERQMPKVPR